jgi:hypothetical protein
MGISPGVALVNTRRMSGERFWIDEQASDESCAFWRRSACVLLASVFGPYARDDEFSSRSINPMELYHNQVTRAQGTFSLRMFHVSKIVHHCD